MPDPQRLVTQEPGSLVNKRFVFDSVSIAKAVNAALDAIPPDENGEIPKTALVAVAQADRQGARLAVAARKDKWHGADWRVMGYLDREWSGELSTGAQVVATW